MYGRSMARLTEKQVETELTPFLVCPLSFSSTYLGLLEDPSPRSSSQPVGRELLGEGSGHLRPSESTDIHITVRNGSKSTVMK